MPDDNGKVTIREVYALILAQDQAMDEMERRILSRLEILPKLAVQVETNQAEINRLRARSDLVDILVAMIATIGSAIAGWIGIRR